MGLMKKNEKKTKYIDTGLTGTERTRASRLKGRESFLGVEAARELRELTLSCSCREEGRQASRRLFLKKSASRNR